MLYEVITHGRELAGVDLLGVGLGLVASGLGRGLGSLGSGLGGFGGGLGGLGGSRITSYNVCYTKLLRSRKAHCLPRGETPRGLCGAGRKPRRTGMTGDKGEKRGEPKLPLSLLTNFISQAAQKATDARRKT